MPSKRKSHPKLAITIDDLKDRIPSNLHSKSQVFVTGRDALGMIMRVPVKGLRVTVGPLGQPDIVEILT